MSGRLAGKTAIVTAAGQGIGLATARAFHAEGARVVATDIDPTKLEGAGLVGARWEARKLDVTDASAIVALATDHPAPDVLFNCAGVVHDGTILTCDEEIWAQALSLNVTSMYRLIRATLPGMAARGGGSIVNVASVASSIIGAPNRFAYGATKAAVIGLTKSVARDFVAHGVRCNAICPGTVETPSLDGRIAAAADPEAARAAFLARQPTGRLGRPEEIAALVVHLASDESAFTTGAAYVVDGGWTA